MRAPLSWLSELTPLAADARDRASVVELASELDSLGLVVEGTDWVGEGLDEVVLARVLEIGAIKGADKIRRVVVDRGEGETVEVVCGAWNFSEGDVVALAPVGSTLPGDFRIERRTLRGVVSNGMLCSGRELELSDDHAGILVLGRPGAHDGSIELGRPLSEHLGFGLDVVFDLAVEPNRPDCLSMVGVARDLAARYGLPLELPEPSLEESGTPAPELATVEIEAPELCQRLIGRVLTGIRPAPSPALVRRRLLLAGMRPINHVVDASNYVMLELGQPNHPYDLGRLGGSGLKVRPAGPGETIVTLDGETRLLGGRSRRGDDPLSDKDLVICNAHDLPVGIAGVMGGQSNEIGEETGAVLLEVARFTPVAVGRTARHVGLRTEASVRFERGVDPEQMERAAARFCQLVVEAATAAGVPAPTVAPGIIDANPVPFTRTRVTLRPPKANALLGLELSPELMGDLLAPIGYERVGDGRPEAALELVVPSWRPDVSREVDVIEDVARTYGYRRIPRTSRRSPSVGRLDASQSLRRRLRRVLTGLGADEAWTGSIVDPGDEELAGAPGGFITVANPMAAEESVMRAGLLAGLMKAVRHNSAHRNPWVRLFEVGDVFAARPGAGGMLPEEHERVALVLARELDDAAGAIRAWRVVAEALGLAEVELRQEAVSAPRDDGEAEVDLRGLHRARSGLLVMPARGERAQSVIGAVGEVDPAVLAAFGLPHGRVGWLELDLVRLAGAPRRPDEAKAVSRYPSSDVDLAFSVDEGVPAAAVEETVRRAAGELCESVQLFDVYRGVGLADGQRSLAFRVRLCASDHTLADAEVAAARRACIEAVEGSLPATLRG